MKCRRVQSVSLHTPGTTQPNISETVLLELWWKKYAVICEPLPRQKLLAVPPISRRHILMLVHSIKPWRPSQLLTVCVSSSAPCREHLDPARSASPTSWHSARTSDHCAGTLLTTRVVGLWTTQHIKLITLVTLQHQLDAAYSYKCNTVCECWTHRYTVQKWLNRLKYCLGCWLTLAQIKCYK